MAIKDTVTRMEAAAYHNDRKRWMRLYVENRISYGKASTAWESGSRKRYQGVPCSCFECKVA